MTPLTATRAPSLFKRYPAFTRLFIARSISSMGDWFHVLAALALLRHIGEEGASSFGWILIFKTVPTLFVTPLAGLLADRLPRRSVMRAADLARASLVLTMLGLQWWPSAWALYVLTALHASVGAFFEPAREALLPELVDKEDLPRASALMSAMWSVAFAVGSALGGLVTAWAGWQVALFLDAGTFLASFWLLSTVPARVPSGAGASMRPTIAELAGGLSYMAGHPRVATLAVVKAGWSLAGGLTVVLTSLGERVFSPPGAPLLGVSLLYTARAVGTGVGPVVARWWSREAPAQMERAIGRAYWVAALAYCALAFADGPVSAALCVVVGHIGGATLWVFSSVRLQQELPDHVRGRVFAAENAGFTFTMAVSTLCLGWVIDSNSIPLRHVPLVLALIIVMPGTLWALRGRWLGWGEASPATESQHPEHPAA